MHSYTRRWHYSRKEEDICSWFILNLRNLFFRIRTLLMLMKSWINSGTNIRLFYEFLKCLLELKRLFGIIKILHYDRNLKIVLLVGFSYFFLLQYLVVHHLFGNPYDSSNNKMRVIQIAQNTIWRLEWK